MLLYRKSPTDFLTLLKNIIYANHSTLNAEANSVIDSVFLQPGSQVLTYLHSILYYLDLIHALDFDPLTTNTNLREDLKSFFVLTDAELDDKIKEDVDKIAETYSLTRISGVAAKGYVRFFTLSNDPVTINSGVQVNTRTSPIITFQTINSVNNYVPKYDSSTGLYYTDIAVECTEIGTSGNLQQNRITQLTSPISGVVSITNTLATVGGKEEETNSELASRIVIRRAGRALPTLKGYRNLVLGSGLVLDCFIATKKDNPDFVTREDSNAVDIFVITSAFNVIVQENIPVAGAVYFTRSRFEAEKQQTYPPAYSPSEEIELVLRRQPVKRITAVARDSVTISSSEYSLVVDTSHRSGSVRAFNKIRTNSQGTTLTISYEYDTAILEVQNLIDAEENRVVNSDVLIRSATELAIDVSIPITVYTEFDEATVKANVESDLTKFFAGGISSYGETFAPKLLGERIDVSDILRVILNVEGVDRINLPSFVVSYGGIGFQKVLSQSASGSFQPNSIQYARLGTVTWV